MSRPEERLNRIAKDLTQGIEVQAVSVRDFLRWFGAMRRGYWIVWQIRQALKRNGLRTDPDFEGVYLDFPIEFRLREEPGESEEEPTEAEAPADPTYRIGKLASANKVPVSVKPDDEVTRAVTLMLANDFSQLPVMTSERDVKGVISWHSLGSRLALGKNCQWVRQCMERHQVIEYDDSLFSAIDTIVRNQYVLIRNAEKKIVGIVTTSDLSVQFQQLGEPFLLIGEIENYVRKMLTGKFSPSELSQARDPVDPGRDVVDVSDLTFGEYGRLMDDPEKWPQLSLNMDRREFVKKLDEVRRIRNDVMHFDPDGIPDTDLATLRDFVSFLQTLAEIEAI